MIAVSSFNPITGDLNGNSQLITDYCKAAVQQGCQLIVFPELALTGYPPEDLLLRPSFINSCQRHIEELAAQLPIPCIIGAPCKLDNQLYNSLFYLANGEVKNIYHKQCLPNYAVFDEQRYFSSFQNTCTIPYKDKSIGLLLCEDIWNPNPISHYKNQTVDAIIVANASPYTHQKLNERINIAQKRTKQAQLPILYTNLYGGQDELVFDGGHFCVNPGQLNTPFCGHLSEGLYFFELNSTGFTMQSKPQPPNSFLDCCQKVIEQGIKDYVHKTGFSKIIIGLSGGIDSALVAALSVNAIGSDNVSAVMLPSQFTSELSLDLARQQANLLNIDYQLIDIEAPFQVMLETLSTSFKGHQPDLTEENLQARIRGSLLMALSNKFNALVLSTSNKSETAVGYATIYGDMCGAYSPLKDLYKTEVYALCDHLNLSKGCIVQKIIDRPPSAELRHNQTDQDSLPDYEQLDEILKLLIEDNKSVDDLISIGFASDTVKHISSLLYINEYKRRQSAPGPKLSTRSFGKDRRYPIVSGWRS
ncbi:MAG: NAD+ synthase [bacterium]